MKRVAAAIAFLIAFVPSAFGQTVVQTVPDFSTLTGHSYPGVGIINLQAYHSAGDQGGGLLSLTTAGATDCPVDPMSGAPDDGQCFEDSGGHYFARENLADNFGLVNVLYYGCQPELGDGGVPVDNGSCFAAAQTAAIRNNLVGINVCGNSQGSEWNIATSFTVTATVSCPTRDANRPETTTVGTPSSGDFTNYPYTLRVSGSSTDKILCGLAPAGSSSPPGISGKLDGVNILRTGLNILPGHSSSTAPTDMQDLWAVKSNYGGTGLDIEGDACQFKNGNILGFDTGIVSAQAREFSLSNYKVDANNCQDFQFQRGGGTIYTVNGQCTNLVTELTPFSAFDLPITGVSDSGGQLKVSLASACTTGNCPAAGTMDVWVTQPYGAQSANGQAWRVTASGSDWLLNNSTSNFLPGGPGQNFPVLSFAINTTILQLDLSMISTACPIKAVPNAFCQVQPGQTVTGGCIPTNDTIAAVWYDYGIIALTTPTNGGSCGAETITLKDAIPPTQFLTGATVVSGGSGYTNNELLTLLGGTCTDQPTVLAKESPGSSAVTSVVIKDPGTCTMFPTSPNSPSGATGTGVMLNVYFNGNLSLSAGVRDGVGTKIEDTISLSTVNSFTNGYRKCLVFGGYQNSTPVGASNSTVVGPNCFSNQVLQDNFQHGILFENTSQANTVIGGAVHYFGGNIISRATISGSSGNLVANRVIGTTIGGNEGNSGPNQILFIDEGCLTTTTVDCVSPPGASHARLELEGVSSQTQGFGFVSDDTASLGIKDSMMPALQVFCQSSATPALIDRTGSTIQSNSCAAPANPTLASAETSPTGAIYYALNANCGQTISSASASAQLDVVLPSNPVAGCRFWFMNDTSHGFGFSIDPNSKSILTAALGSVTSPVTILPSANVSNTSTVAAPTVSLVFDGARWIFDSGDPGILTANALSTPSARLVGQLTPSTAPLIANGQVYFSYDGSTNFRVCPYNGPGGLVINGAMNHIPRGCVFFAKGSTHSNTLNYFYVFSKIVSVTSITFDGSGHAVLQLPAAPGSFVSGASLTCANFPAGSTPAANVKDDPNTVLSGSSSITLSDVTFAHTGAGTCQYLAMDSSATGYVYDSNGIAVKNGTTNETLVGMAYIGASTTVNDGPGKRDVASYYNRQPRKMVVVGASGTTSATNSAGTTTFETPGTKIEGEFVAFGRPTMLDLGTAELPVPGVQWSITASATAGASTTSGSISACFSSSSQMGGAACTNAAETEVATSALSGSTAALATSGMAVCEIDATACNLVEGRNFMDFVANIPGGGTIDFPISGMTIDAFVWQ
jgi:hypothetical protein